MKYEKTNFASAPEILKRKLGGEYIVPVTLAAGAFTNGVCKGGSPISAAGVVANTNDAVGILANDVFEENPNGPLIKAFAVVNLTNAEANTGLTIAAGVKTALPNIYFEA